MTRRFRIVTYVLAAALGLSLLADSADRAASLASQADLDAAIAKRLGEEDAARTTITTLLHRDELRRMTAGYRLDLRRAEAAVGTLQGDELQRLSRLAANADAQLAGGDVQGVLAGIVVGVLVLYLVFIAANASVKT